MNYIFVKRAGFPCEIQLDLVISLCLVFLNIMSFVGLTPSVNANHLTLASVSD